MDKMPDWYEDIRNQISEGEGLRKRGFQLRPELEDLMSFNRAGQTPYGEWLKRLGPLDRPPRGRCTTYFVKHSQLRRFK